MTRDMTGKSLKDAYSVETPDDSVRLYADWAKSYDEDFAREHCYILPEAIADVFRDAGGQGPVLDIGAGTGLVAEHLRRTVDGLDISAEMLEIAGGKGLYRNRILADLTKPLPVSDQAYRGFVSAGTFTHGHVGPECLPELMRVAAPGALFCLGINAGVFDRMGFGSAFALLSARGEIGEIGFREVGLYDSGASHEHAGDQGLIAVFRRK